jgi:hypothetical protein
MATTTMEEKMRSNAPGGIHRQYARITCTERSVFDDVHASKHMPPAHSSKWNTAAATNEAVAVMLLPRV